MNAWVCRDKSNVYGPPHNFPYVVMFVGGLTPVLDTHGFWNQPSGNRVVIQGYLANTFEDIGYGEIRAYTLTPQ